MKFHLVCASLFLVGCSLKADLTWPAGTENNGAIVIRSAPSPAERFAAEELQNYLEKRCGVRLPLTEKMPDTGPAFIIGHHPENAMYTREINQRGKEHYDSFVTAVKGNRVHLTGRNGTGIMFSVWHLLEKTGIAWLMPGRNGIYIPPKSKVTWKEEADYQIPVFEYRATSVTSGSGEYARKKVGAPESLLQDTEHGQNASRLWSWRMRLSPVPLQEKDNFPNLGSGHSYMYYLPVAKYGKDHPEWYNMRNGRRQNKPSDPWQVCFTNQEAARTFAENCRAAVQGYLKQGVPIDRIRVSVSPNDYRANCECDNCRKIFDSGTGTASSQVMHFANLVHKELAKTFPGIRVYYYVYNNHGRIPEHGKPASGVIPDITSWTSNDSLAVNHAKPLFSSANRQYQKIFGWYAQNCDLLSVYAYYVHYAFVTPFPVLTQMPDDFRHWAKTGKVREFYCESHLNWGTQNLTLYLMPKLLWNPQLDVRKVITDYCRKAYGPAADEMRSYHKILQKKMDSLSLVVGDPQEIPMLLSPDVIQACNARINAAEAKIPLMDEKTAWRTRLAVEAWRYSALLADIRREINTNRNPGHREKLKSKILKFKEFCSSDLGRWAFEYRMSHIQAPLDGVNFDLQALPEGRNLLWSDNFYFGGTSKMYFKLKNVRPDRWGYLAEQGKPAVMELPLRAAPGLVIDRLSFQFSGMPGNSARLTISAGNGKNWTTENFIGRTLELPEKLRNCSALTFRFEFMLPKSTKRDYGYVMNRGRMNISTKKAGQ